MEKATEEKADLQWHPAFYAGLQIELAEEAQYLEFENEHQLGTKPKEIDVLVVKKNPEVTITKNIGRIFRTHNIFEYKNPRDYLSIDDFYKVHGYACFYKSDVNTVDAIKAWEITISFVTKYYPRNVIKHLQKEQHLQVKKQERGIYYVFGDYFPIQFIVTSQLTEEENLWLYNLTNDIQGIDRINRLLKEYREHQNDNLHKSVMNLIVSANKEIFEEANGSMCEALYELMKDQIEEQVKQQVEEQVKQQVEEQVKQQVEEQVKQQVEEQVKQQVEERVKQQVEEQVKRRVEERVKQQVGEEVKKTIISLVKDGLLSITDAAKRLSISEEECVRAMEMTEV